MFGDFLCVLPFIAAVSGNGNVFLASFIPVVGLLLKLLIEEHFARNRFSRTNHKIDEKTEETKRTITEAKNEVNLTTTTKVDENTQISTKAFVEANNFKVRLSSILGVMRIFVTQVQSGKASPEVIEKLTKALDSIENDKG